MSGSPTANGVVWCKRCQTHQALVANGSVCAVCAPGKSQSAEIQQRSDEELARIDRVLDPARRDSGTTQPYYDEAHDNLSRAVHEGRRRDAAAGYQFSHDGRPAESFQTTTEVHEVKRVANRMMVSPEAWPPPSADGVERRAELWRLVARELEVYARGEGLWLVEGTLKAEVLESVFMPWTLPSVVRWWHRFLLPSRRPKPVRCGSHRREKGEAPLGTPGLVGYQIGATCNAVDLPPEYHGPLQDGRQAMQVIRPGGH